MDGVVVVDKPAGMTSHDVVDEVRRRLGTRKVGHGGTLDPDATGVLVVGLGRATRLLSYAQRAPKRYEAEAVFGITTTTQDAAGDVIDSRPVSLDASEVVAATKAFVGAIEQVPPMVSAVKLGGERLYRKARRGEDVDRGPRPVTVYAFELVELVPGDHPRARFEVHCSGGTYVRTLIHDLGAALGCGAHMSSLRRIASGGFTLDDAVPLEAVDERAVRPLVDAVRDLPSIEVNDDGARSVSHGRALHVGDLPPEFVAEGEPVALTHAGDLVAVYRRKERDLVPDRVMPA